MVVNWCFSDLKIKLVHHNYIDLYSKKRGIAKHSDVNRWRIDHRGRNTKAILIWILNRKRRDQGIYFGFLKCRNCSRYVSCKVRQKPYSSVEGIIGIDAEEIKLSICKGSSYGHIHIVHESNRNVASDLHDCSELGVENSWGIDIYLKIYRLGCLLDLKITDRYDGPNIIVRCRYGKGLRVSKIRRSTCWSEWNFMVTAFHVVLKREICKLRKTIT